MCLEPRKWSGRLHTICAGVELNGDVLPRAYRCLKCRDECVYSSDLYWSHHARAKEMSNCIKEVLSGKDFFYTIRHSSFLFVYYWYNRNRIAFIILVRMYIKIGKKYFNSYLPPKVKLPVETTPSHIGGLYVLEGGVWDDVDDGAHHRCAVLHDTSQQRLQPTLYKNVKKYKSQYLLGITTL